jgi:hypothetical protein
MEVHACTRPEPTMSQRLAQALTTWPFVVSLLALLLNDFWFKYSSPGVVTGKLSDFAGIGVVTMLLVAMYPRRRLLVYAFLAGGFAFWKSPASKAFIDLLNAYLPFPTARTVDYTDLLALLVMPLYAAAAQSAQSRMPNRLRRRLLFPPVAVATAFALMATSVPTIHELYQVRQMDPAAELNRTVIASAVAEVAKEFDMVCQDCVNPLEQARFDGKGLHFFYSYPDDRTIDFRVQAFGDGFFFGPTGLEKAAELKIALKKRLDRVYTRLEYSVRPGNVRPGEDRY